MPTPAGIVTTCTYPGIVAVIGGTFTQGHGETPGVCILQIVPQPKAPKTIGTLSITYGSVGLTFERCRVVASRIRRDSSGQIVEVVIQDWRWEWQDRGYMNCRYNLRDGDGKLVDHWEKSPQEIAKEAFKAFGQANSGVDQLAERCASARRLDDGKPARALSTLCESLGCRIALKFSNRCDIVRLGKGQAATARRAVSVDQSSTRSFDPPEKPGAIMVVGGRPSFKSTSNSKRLRSEATGEYVLLDDATRETYRRLVKDATANFDGLPGRVRER